MFLSKRMTPNPIIVSPTTTVIDAAELMRTNNIRRLPVVENGKLVGIVTDRDLRQVSASPATSLSIYELNYLLAKMMVKDVMQKKVITIQEEATIEEAALLMYNNKIGGLVVVNDQNKVSGIITETDIFKLFVDVMGLPQGKTRITLDVVDGIGVIYEISAVFKELNINIGSFVTLPLGDGQAELVIRADVSDTDLLARALKDKGFIVKHIVQIG